MRWDLRTECPPSLQGSYLRIALPRAGFSTSGSLCLHFRVSPHPVIVLFLYPAFCPRVLHRPLYPLLPALSPSSLLTVNKMTENAKCQALCLTRVTSVGVLYHHYCHCPSDLLESDRPRVESRPPSPSLWTLSEMHTFCEHQIPIHRQWFLNFPALLLGCAK